MHCDIQYELIFYKQSLLQKKSVNAIDLFVITQIERLLSGDKAETEAAFNLLLKKYTEETKSEINAISVAPKNDEILITVETKSETDQESAETKSKETPIANEYTDLACILGLCYKEGIGTKQNKDLAKNLFHKLANQGHIRSLYFLGLLQAEADGFSLNTEILHAYKNNDPAALWFMADHQEYKVQEKENTPEQRKNLLENAEKYYVKSAELGYAKAQYALSLFYQSYYSVSNSKKSFSLLEQAAKNGYALAQQTLGNWYKLGKFCKKDIKKAIEYLTTSEQNGMQTKSMLASCYDNLETELTSLEEIKALCEQGQQRQNAAAILKLAELYERGAEEEQYSKSRKSFKLWKTSKASKTSQTSKASQTTKTSIPRNLFTAFTLYRTVSRLLNPEETSWIKKANEKLIGFNRFVANIRAKQKTELGDKKTSHEEMNFLLQYNEALEQYNTGVKNALSDYFISDYFKGHFALPLQHLIFEYSYLPDYFTTEESQVKFIDYTEFNGVKKLDPITGEAERRWDAMECPVRCK